MQNILLGTNNPGKLREMKELLDGLNALLISPSEAGLKLNIVEEGETYAENAVRKALAFAEESGLLTLSDDSGLEVDVLEGAPGLYSARYAPRPGATDADRRDYLLHQLKGRARPWTARFRCVAALATPGGLVETKEGICEGEVIPDERGSGGFGYDPIFYLPTMDKTMAELSFAQKNQISHRAQALAATRPILERLLRE